MHFRSIQLSAACGLLALATACGKGEPAPRSEPVPRGAKLIGSEDAASPANMTSATGTALCASLCRKTATLKCTELVDCLYDCATMREALRACDSALHAVFTCMLKEPLDHFVCQEEGIPGVQEAYCGPEQAALASCISEHGH